MDTVNRQILVPHDSCTVILFEFSSKKLTDPFNNPVSIGYFAGNIIITWGMKYYLDKYYALESSELDATTDAGFDFHH